MKNRVRTLLQVLPDLPSSSSGVGWVVEGVASAMQARGWRVERVTAEDVLPKTMGRTYLAVPVALARRARRAARRLSAEGACVVECHGFWGGVVASSLWMRRIPNVVTVFRGHGFWRAAVAVAAADDNGGGAAPNVLRTFKSELTYGTLEKMATRLSDLVVVQNSSDARFAELVDGVRADRILIAPPGIAVPATGGTSTRGTTIRVLWVGRRSLVKGSDFLPEIIRILQQRRVPIEIELIGHDQIGFDAAPNLIVRPHLPRAEVAEAMARADVFLWTSRYEGFGLAPFEAMASGVPVISARVGGLVDFLHDGDNGIVVERPDAAAFADAVARFATLVPEARLRLASSARRSVAGLTWERHADELDQFVTPFLDREPERWRSATI
jgi:glycosyltransferase involved in cell wall biosynthesis